MEERVKDLWRKLDAFRGSHGTIHYCLKHGADTAVPLILLHGLGASCNQFDALAEKTGDDQSVLMVDFPGHGDNLADEDLPIGFVSFSGLLISLCDHLELKNAVFAGISMGGSIALCCAAARPDLVRRLVVIRPAWLAAPDPAHLALIDRCGRWIIDLSMIEALSALEHDQEYIEMLSDIPLAASSLRTVFERDHAVDHAPVLSAMYHSAPFAALSELRAIKAPATIVSNNADSFHPPAIAKATANALPNADLKILPPRYLQPENHQTAITDLVLQEIGIAA